MAKNNFSIIPDNAITELSKEIYKDVGHPILKEVGNIGESVMKFVALPFKFLGLTSDQLEIKYKEFLQKSQDKVLPDERVIPRAVIAAPLLDYIKFVFDEDGLSEMFSNLLANAMHKNIEKMVHPAYIEILKQMSPLDVEFLNTFFKEYDLVESEDLIWERSDSQKTLSVESLHRLGIINSISYDDREDVAIVLTSFGKVFRNLCMLKPSDNDEITYMNDTMNNFDNELNEDEQLSYSDTFSTAKISTDSNRLYIRQRFDYEDVKRGSNIVLLLRINNIGNSNIHINKLFLDDGSNFHYFIENELPVCIYKGKYKDFIFKHAEDNNLLSAVMNENAHYFLQTNDHNYSFYPTSDTKKEIGLFLKNI